MLFIGLHLIHNLRRYILQHQLLVVVEEHLTIYQNLLHFLAVVGNLAFVVNHDARQLLNQLFHHRAWRERERRCIVHHGVIHQRHLRQFAFHHRLCQQLGILLHQDILHLLVAALACQGEGKGLSLVAHVGHL